MKIIYLLLVFLMPITTFAQKADDIVGTWLTEEKDGKIKIYKENGKFYGKLVWGKDLYDENGQPRLDVNNPDEKLQNRPLDNLVLLSGFEFTGDQWEDGKIYDPNSGKTYNCYMEINGNQLEVTGYVGVKWLSRTVTWTKVSK